MKKSLLLFSLLLATVAVFGQITNRNVTVCRGTTFQLPFTNNNNTNFQWLPVTNLSCTTCATPSVTTPTAGIFTYRISYNSGATVVKDSVTITVLSGQAPAYQISANKGICLGKTTTLGGALQTGTTYSWTSVPAGFTSIGENPTVAPTETTKYILTATNASCPLPIRDSVTVTVSTEPVFTLANAATICQGDKVQLMTSTPESDVTYAWLPKTALDDVNSPNPTATPDNTTTYTLTAARGGCAVSGTVALNVTPIKITLNTGDTARVCKGQSINLQATVIPATAVANWLPDNATLNVQTGNNVVATPRLGITYRATITNQNCVRTAKVFVKIDSLPYNLRVMPKDTFLCQGQIAILKTPAYEQPDFPNIKFKWIPQDGQLSADSLFNLVIQPSKTTTYKRVVTNGACVDTSSAHVLVIPITMITVVPPDPRICDGGQIALTASGKDVTDFEWTPVTGLSCTKCTNPTASPRSTTPYQVKGKGPMGCPASGQVTVTVDQKPSVTFPISTTICLGQSVALNSTPNPNYTYNWISSDATFNAKTEPNPIVSPKQNTTYSVTITEPNNACGTNGQQITINTASERITSITSDTTICPGSPVILRAVVSGGNGTFIWSPGNSSGSQITVNPTNTTNYAVTYTYGNGCQDIRAVRVTVRPSISFALVGRPASGSTVNLGDAVRLKAVANPSTGVTYSWLENDKTISGQTLDSLVIVPPYNKENPIVKYTVIATTAQGCRYQAEVNYTVQPPEWKIPSAFTPDGDAVNDEFKVFLKGKADARKIMVFNRWGKVMYESTDIKLGWDGKHNGEPVPSDVYVYYIEFALSDGSTQVEKGDITLIR